MNIREACVEDKNALAEIFLEENLYHNDIESEAINRLFIDAILPDGWLEDVISSDNKKLYIYEKDETAVGLIMFSIHRTDDDLFKIKRWIHINEIAVLSDHRGKGIGGTLLGFVDEYARKNDINNIRLEVWSSNESAIRFYVKNGYMSKKHIMWKDL